MLFILNEFVVVVVVVGCSAIYLSIYNIMYI